MHAFCHIITRYSLKKMSNCEHTMIWVFVRRIKVMICHKPCNIIVIYIFPPSLYCHIIFYLFFNSIRLMNVKSVELLLILYRLLYTERLFYIIFSHGLWFIYLICSVRYTALFNSFFKAFI